MTLHSAAATLARFGRAVRRRLAERLRGRKAAALTLEQRVVERTEELQDLNEELEAFSYSVSHDLRAPLRHIDGFAKLLTRHLGTGDPLVTHYLDRITDQTRQAETLIEKLLAFSRMGRTPLVRHDVDVQKMVGEVVADLTTGEQRERDVHWTIDRLPHVEADPAMLRVVWTNLLDNALKYSQPRAVAEVQVGAEPRDGQTSFFVRDNGVGFDMRFAARLFGVFQRFHSKDQFPGSGIGLATVRRIVARHAGHTGGVGRVDHGATFWFSLPDASVGAPHPSPA